MSINYTYEIIKVDPTAKAMEIVYSASGRQTLHIGTRMPYVGESLEAIVRMYEPIAYWREQETEVIEVGLGHTGTITFPEPAPMTLARAKDEKLADIAIWRYEREISGIVVNGALIKTDREAQASLNSTFASLSSGFVANVDWKTASGEFVSMGLNEITQVAQAVAAHVQDCFSKEKAIADAVRSATTIAEVQAIDPNVMFPSQFGVIPSTEV